MKDTRTIDQLEQALKREEYYADYYATSDLGVAAVYRKRAQALREEIGRRKEKLMPGFEALRVQPPTPHP